MWEKRNGTAVYAYYNKQNDITLLNVISRVKQYIFTGSQQQPFAVNANM